MNINILVFDKIFYRNYNSVWHGLNDIRTQESYVWTDGSSRDFIRWDYGQPDLSDQQCGCYWEILSKTYSTSGWHDCTCAWMQHYVCKM